MGINNATHIIRLKNSIIFFASAETAERLKRQNRLSAPVEPISQKKAGEFQRELEQNVEPSIKFEDKTWHG